MGKYKEKTKRDLAVDFLNDRMQDGKEHGARELQDDAFRLFQVDARTLQRAAADLNVEKRKTGKGWLWIKKTTTAAASV
jgi:hypothetical protein